MKEFDFEPLRRLGPTCLHSTLLLNYRCPSKSKPAPLNGIQRELDRLKFVSGQILL